MPQSPAPSSAMADDSQTSKIGDDGKRPFVVAPLRAATVSQTPITRDEKLTRPPNGSSLRVGTH